MKHFICGPYWRFLMSAYNINTFEIVSFFFNPEDLETPNEYELDVSDINEKLKEWAINTDNRFVLCFNT
jgi:predicted adenine nucleotide alpha hydrolase (AANH) superfamily ATPase